MTDTTIESVQSPTPQPPEGFTLQGGVPGGYRPRSEDLMAAVAREEARIEESAELLAPENLPPIDLEAMGLGDLTVGDIQELDVRAATVRGLRESAAPEAADAPILGYGFEVKEYRKLQEAAAAVQVGKATRDQQRLYLGTVIESQRDQTFIGGVGEMAKGTAVFAAETGIGAVVSGGAVSVGIRTARAAVRFGMKRLRKEMVENSRQRFLKSVIDAVPKSVRAGARTVAGTTILQEVAPRVLNPDGADDGGAWTAASMRRVFPDWEMTDEQADLIAAWSNDSMSDVLNSQVPLWKGFVETLMLNTVERSGAALTKLPPVAYLKAFEARAIRKMAGGAPDPVTEALKQVGNRAAWDGPMMETIEEVVGGASVEAVVGDNILDGLPADFEELAQIITVSSLPSGLGAARQRLRNGHLARLRKKGEQAAETGGLPVTDAGGQPLPEPTQGPSQDTTQADSESEADAVPIEGPTQEQLEANDQAIREALESQGDPFKAHGLPLVPNQTALETPLAERLNRRSRGQRLKSPITLLDHVLELGGINITAPSFVSQADAGPTNEAADVEARIGEFVNGSKGLRGLVVRTGDGGGLRPDDLTGALAEQGFRNEQEADGRLSISEVLDALESELAGESALIHPLDRLELDALEDRRIRDYEQTLFEVNYAAAGPGVASAAPPVSSRQPGGPQEPQDATDGVTGESEGVNPAEDNSGPLSAAQGGDPAGARPEERPEAEIAPPTTPASALDAALGLGGDPDASLDEFLEGGTPLEFGSPNRAAEPNDPRRRSPRITPAVSDLSFQAPRNANEAPNEGRAPGQTGDLQVPETGSPKADPEALPRIDNRGGKSILRDGDQELEPIGNALFGTIKDVRFKQGATYSNADVSAALMNVAKVAGGSSDLRTSNVPKTALGVFRPQLDIIDIRRTGDVDTTAHEVAHSIEVSLFGLRNPWTKGGAAQITQTHRAELVALGKQLYGTTRPNGGYMREGWAEFVRIYLMQGGTRQAPAMHGWFESVLLPAHPKLAKAIRNASDISRAFRTQGSMERVQAQVAKGATSGIRGEVRKFQGRAKVLGNKDAAIEAGTTLGERLGDLMVESLGPLRRMAKAAETIRGDLLPSERNPYKVAKTFRGAAAARVSDWVDNGPTDLAGNRRGIKPLKEIGALVKGRHTEFAAYLFARRAKALWEQPLIERDMMRAGETAAQAIARIAETQHTRKRQPLEATLDQETILRELGARDPGASYTDVLVALNDLDAPDFRLAAETVYQWSDATLDYMGEASATLARSVAIIRKADPGDYVPLARVINEGRQAFSGINVVGGEVSKRLKGSGRIVKDPLSSLLADTQKRVAAAHRRAVMESTIALAQQEPRLGEFVREVPADQVPVAQRSVSDLLELIVKEAEADGVDPETVAALNDLLGQEVGEDGQAEEAGLAAVLENAITFFEPARQRKDRVGNFVAIPVLDGSKLRHFEVRTDIAEALEELDPQDASNVVTWALGASKRYFTLGTTGLSPDFALATNPLRDIQTFAMQSRIGNPAELWNHYQAATGEVLKGALNKDPKALAKLDRFNALGLRMAQRYAEDRDFTSRAARRIQKGDVKIRDVDGPIDFALYIGDRIAAMADTAYDTLGAPEMVPRIAEMTITADQLGIDVTKDITFGQSVELALAAREVTVDFTASGTWARQINRFVPFFNAAIQGKRAMARAWRKDPAGFVAAQIAYGVVPSAALWWLNKDEEWYQELSDEDRYHAFYMRVPGTREVLRIPRAQELHLFSATYPEILLNALYQEDPEAAGSAYKRLTNTAGSLYGQTTKQVALPMAPPIAVTVGEQLANRQFFWDRPIVSRSLERLPEEQQFNEYTSRTAIEVGAILGESPQRIDHMVRSMFGTLGRLGMQVTGGAIDTVAGRSSLQGELPEQDFELTDTPILGRLFRRGGDSATRPKSVDALYTALEVASKHQADRHSEETREERDARLVLSDATQAVQFLATVRRAAKDRDQAAQISSLRVQIARDALRAIKTDRPGVQRPRFTNERKRAEEQAKRAQRGQPE